MNAPITAAPSLFKDAYFYAMHLPNRAGSQLGIHLSELKENIAHFRESCFSDALQVIAHRGDDWKTMSINELRSHMEVICKMDLIPLSSTTKLHMETIVTALQGDASLAIYLNPVEKHISQLLLRAARNRGLPFLDYTAFSPLYSNYNLAESKTIMQTENGFKVLTPGEITWRRGVPTCKPELETFTTHEYAEIVRNSEWEDFEQLATLAACRKTLSACFSHSPPTLVRNRDENSFEIHGNGSATLNGDPLHSVKANTLRDLCEIVQAIIQEHLTRFQGLPDFSISDANGVKFSFQTVDTFDPLPIYNSSEIAIPKVIVDFFLRCDSKGNQTYTRTVTSPDWDTKLFRFVEDLLEKDTYGMNIKRDLGIDDLRALTPQQAVRLCGLICTYLFQYDKCPQDQYGLVADKKDCLTLLKEGKAARDENRWDTFTGNGVCRNIAAAQKAIFEALKENQFPATSMLRNGYCLYDSGSHHRPGQQYTGKEITEHAWNIFLFVAPENIICSCSDATWAIQGLTTRSTIVTLEQLDHTLVRLQPLLFEIGKDLLKDGNTHPERFETLTEYYEKRITQGSSIENQLHFASAYLKLCSATNFQPKDTILKQVETIADRYRTTLLWAPTLEEKIKAVIPYLRFCKDSGLPIQKELIIELAQIVEADPELLKRNTALGSPLTSYYADRFILEQDPAKKIQLFKSYSDLLNQTRHKPDDRTYLAVAQTLCQFAIGHPELMTFECVMRLDSSTDVCPEAEEALKAIKGHATKTNDYNLLVLLR